MPPVPSSIILLHFDEPDGGGISDALGNLDDLHGDVGINAPTRVSTFTGFGRNFVQASSQALIASDLSDKGTLLLRDVTVQALLSIRQAGADDGPFTVIARGTHDGSASERYAYGLELVNHVDLAGYLEVRFFHETAGGVVRTLPPGVFQHLGDDKEFMLTATRRWQASDSVAVRYYVNDECIAEVESTDGDISGGTVGTTTVGGRKNGGAWEGFFSGTIDELMVCDYEMSLEEIRHTWKRLTEYQPQGVEMLAALCPPGLNWYKDPGNKMGRRIKVAGQMLGLSLAAIEEMRSMWLPRRSPLSRIGEWEGLCGLAPRARDSLDVRRARVFGYLSREEGFNLPAIRVALSSMLDVPEVDDIEIIEATNTITDDFTTLDTDQKWLVGPTGAWTNPAGQAHVKVNAGTDIRYATVGMVSHIRYGLDVNDAAPIPNSGVSAIGLGSIPVRVYASVKLSGFGAIPASSGTGILLWNRLTNDALWFGVYNLAGALKIAWYPIVAGVPGAVTVLAAAAAVPTWLRVQMTDGGALGRYDFKWSTVGPATGFANSLNVAVGITVPQWAGLGAWSTIAAPATDIETDFDDWMSHVFDGLRVYAWYARRDPALPGAPDLLGARALAKRLKPAHTDADVCEQLYVLCDDPRYGLCDQNPCGGW